LSGMPFCVTMRTSREFEGEGYCSIVSDSSREAEYHITTESRPAARDAYKLMLISICASALERVWFY